MWRFLIPLKREDVILWNIVPWYLGTEAGIRPANRRDIGEARMYLGKLLKLLPSIEFIVLMGKHAKSEHGAIANLISEAGRSVEILETVHPSPKVMNTQPHRRGEIEDTIRKIGYKIGFNKLY